MPLRGSFGDLKFKLIEGYRIAALFTPGEGIQQNFHVYLWERIDARNAFDAPVDLGDDGPSPQETLVLEDDIRTYEFTDIDLTYVEYGVNRRERFRLLEFRYDSEILNDKAVPVSLQNQDTKKLAAANLRQDYTFSLDGPAEQLLGFRARVSAHDSCVYRFAAYRNKENSFVELLTSLHDKTVPTHAKMEDFTITFSKGDLKVTRDNLLRAYAEESYGHMRGFRPVSLSDLLVGGADVERARMTLWATRPSALLDYDSATSFRTASLRSETVQMGTFVFEKGAHRNPKVT